ncbi:hypothetical protein Nepgr_033989, partial [Nepenthes gracilis]
MAAAAAKSSCKLISQSSEVTVISRLNSIDFRSTHLGFESKISRRRWGWLATANGRRGGREWVAKREKTTGKVKCTAEGFLIGGREERKVVKVGAVAERYKVVLLVALVMCLCNADRVVMSIAVVPMAAKHGWSSSFLGIVQ